MKNKVYLERVFECASDKLFNYLTEPALISQWFGPKNLSIGKVHADVTVGGAYSIELLRDNQHAFLIEGQYLEVKRPELLRFSYQYIGLEGRPDSTVTFTIEKKGSGSSNLRMVQEFQFETPDFETRTQAWNHMFSVLEEIINL